MRLVLLALLSLASISFATVPDHDASVPRDTRPAPLMPKKASTFAAVNKPAPKEAKSTEPTTPEPERKRDTRPSPDRKPSRPAYLFM